MENGSMIPVLMHLNRFLSTCYWVALETLAVFLKLAGAEVDQSMIGIVKNDILMLVDSIESYGFLFHLFYHFLPLCFSLTSKDQIKVTVNTVGIRSTPFNCETCASYQFCFQGFPC
ncbi:uncharacterized protein [Aristolochia californica]|uniref:uncharacterized protein isoform X2 n=1 Tax=Aristolochia californica TaxID=171875 RepID=UPI0035DE0976